MTVKTDTALVHDRRVPKNTICEGQLDFFTFSQVTAPSPTLTKKKSKSKNIAGQVDLFCDGAPNTVSYESVILERPMVNEEILSGDALIRKYEGLVKIILARFIKGGGKVADVDDAMQEGRIAVLMASKSFDPTRGIKFTTYASKAVYRAIIDCAKGGSNNKLRVVSIGAMTEQAGELDYAPIQFAAPIEDTPEFLTEDSEAVRLLLAMADETPRSKENKGIKALAMKVAGYDPKTIQTHMKIEPKSFTAMTSAAKKVLQNAPKVLDLLSESRTVQCTSNILGEQYNFEYAKNATYNCNSIGLGEHLSQFAELLANEDMANSLLDSVPVGAEVYIIDGDTKLNTSFIYGADTITVTSVHNSKSRPLLVATA